MFKSIAYNWGVKLICFFLAIFLWTYVAVGESQVNNLPGKIALSVKNVSSDLVAITDIESVQIKVSSDRSTWQTLSANSFEAWIDLKDVQKGTNEVVVNVKSNILNVNIVQIIPDKVLVRLEPISKKVVEVKVQAIGEAGEGLVPGDVIVSPTRVEISGPQSIIDKIFEATATMQLNGETNEINKTVELAALDAQGEAIKYISFKPRDVTIALPLVKAGTTKTVGIKVQLTGQPKSGFWVNQITTSPSSLTIRGSSTILKNINYIQTKPLDITNLSDNLSKSVDLDLPAGISLVDNITQVKVSLQVVANDTTKQLSASINYENLLSNLKIDSTDPTIINIIVSGSFDKLSTLSSSDIKLNLDLLGLGVGSSSIDITKSMFSLPEGVSFISVLPSSIKVTLVNK